MTTVGMAVRNPKICRCMSQKVVDSESGRCSTPWSGAQTRISESGRDCLNLRAWTMHLSLFRKRTSFENSSTTVLIRRWSAVYLTVVSPSPVDRRRMRDGSGLRIVLFGPSYRLGAVNLHWQAPSESSPSPSRRHQHLGIGPGEG